MSETILQEEKRCFYCGREDRLEHHHVFFGQDRANSEKYGLWIWSCMEHHRGTNGVHFNRSTDLRLKQYAQRIFNKKLPDVTFTDHFYKNYL